MMAKVAKIQRCTSKKKLDVLEQTIQILSYSQSFGKGTYPHNRSYKTIKEMLSHYNTKDYKERANYKSARQYLKFLKKLYQMYFEYELYKHKGESLKELTKEAEELSQLSDTQLENL